MLDAFKRLGNAQRRARLSVLCAGAAAIALGTLALSGTPVPKAHGMAFERASALNTGGCAVGSKFADLVSAPDDVYRWTQSTIYYKRTSSFKSAFPHLLFRRQTRLAFAAWDEAFSRPNGASMSYMSTSNGGVANAFWDFRTLMVHEIGHALGLQHPDEAYNILPANNRNFGYDSTGALVKATADPEWVMSTIDTSGFDLNKYNQLLSWDDVAAIRYNHAGMDLDFVETNNPWLADIRLHALDFSMDQDVDDQCGIDVNATTLAYAKVTDSEPVDPSDPSKGREIQRADIWFNANTSALFAPIAVRTRKVLWDVQLAPVPMGSPTPEPIIAVQAQTRRANASVPLRHFDNTSVPAPAVPQPFQWFRTLQNDPAILDRLFHTWTDPVGGGIPWNAPIRVGLKQDVDNWWTEFIRIVHGAYAAGEVEGPFPVTLPPINVTEIEILGEIPANAAQEAVLQPAPGAAGIVLSNPPDPSQVLRVARLAIGDATAGGSVEASALELPDLAPELLADRFQLHELPVASIEGLQALSPGASFYVFVSGDPSLLPSTMTNFVFVADLLGADVAEELEGRPLIVVAIGVADQATVTTSTMLGLPPISSMAWPRGAPPIYLPLGMTGGGAAP